MRKFIENTKQKIINSWFVQKSKLLAQRIILPGFEGVSIYEVGEFFVTEIRKGEIPIRASAISYKFFMALFPGVVVLLSLIPYIPIENFQEQLLQTIQNVFPEEIYKYAQVLIEDLVMKKHNTILSLGFVMSMYYASSAINTIFVSFQKSGNVRSRNGFLNSIIAFSGIPITMLFVLLAFTIGAMMDFGIEYITDVAIFKNAPSTFILKLLKFVIMILFFITGVSLLYNAANPDRSWRLITTGGSFATLAFIVVNQAFSYYITNFNIYNGLYGSLGALIISMLTVYFNAVILLIGFELNASISAAKKRRVSRLGK